jgi:PII-like signaling protein
MGRYLIIANRALGAVPLHHEVRLRVEAGHRRAHLLVPTERAGMAPSTDPDDDADARLQAELVALAELGAQVTGTVVDGEVLEEVRATLAAEVFDAIIVVTLPGGLSSWLRRGLLDEVAQLTDAPVIHLVSPAGASSRMTTTASRLTVYLGESDRSHGRARSSELVRRARAAGLAGATVLRGLEGFGGSQVLHTSRLLSLSDDLPILVILVDVPERIDGFLPVLDELVDGGLVVREEVEVIKYAGVAAPRAGGHG